ncbi:MAG: dihydrodipicolinate synthase family protein [Proteobacteria bacterium]|nr:dihydrodipicolinate synthase family protein [Pseudomonadota bacterium]
MYKGVLIPVITPFFDDNSVDEPVLRQLVDFYVGASVQGLFALGSSGQGPVLSEAERKAVAEIILDQNAGRVPSITCLGCADTPTTVALAKHAAASGADAIGVIPPYYYCDAPQSAILEHFKAVSDAAQLPIFIYENPKYCGISIAPEFGVRLKKEVPLIRAMKIAYGAGEMADYVKMFPDDVSVFTGNGDIFGLVPFGVAGMINPPTSAVPELCVALYKALEAKDYAKARDLQDKVNTITQMFIATQKRHGRGTLGETFRVRGFPVKRFPRWTTAPLPEEAKDTIRQAFRDAGIED